MKQKLFSLVSLTTVLYLYLSSCLKPEPTVIQPPSTGMLKIVQLKGTRSVNSLDSMPIIYNQHGNPVSIMPTHVSTGYPAYLFGYDRQNRLLTYIGSYMNNNYFESAHKYAYDQLNRVVLDSMMIFGTYSDDLQTIIKDPRGFLKVTTYSYDHLNRLIKAVEVGLSYDIDTTTISYSYNTAGNVWKIHTVYVSPAYPERNSISDAFPSYDNKTNYHQLHKVWQVIDRDYNRNNVYGANTYNSLGLPVSITIDYKQYRPVLGISFDSVGIRYGF
ncbi:MAG TPA: hypothetical protein VM802_25310 [Chitinophaga sp.]|uniref:hypothetical protein n=1 Tax=Chitinophaga sp. TaxID=1869181 RepID=UPI002C423D06|nr:hypothetical protein [Chitinophaga sp.]HVI48211.1 hypothetical protein [Chitinophaga sp.]